MKKTVFIFLLLAALGVHGQSYPKSIEGIKWYINKMQYGADTVDLNSFAAFVKTNKPFFEEEGSPVKSADSLNAGELQELKFIYDEAVKMNVTFARGRMFLNKFPEMDSDSSTLYSYDAATGRIKTTVANRDEAGDITAAYIDAKGELVLEMIDEEETYRVWLRRKD